MCLCSVKRAEVEVIRLEGDAQVDLKLATAQANAARDIAKARSDASLSITQQEASSYARLASELG